MAKKLEFWGVLGTLVYLAIITATVGFKFDKFLALDLNELGDFLAGAFGPIAFLWLVLGFLQQGRELRLSTHALQLQAEELKHSVEQQSIMADAAVRQIDAARQALELQVQEAERALIADFEVRPYLKTGGPKGILNKIKIVNNRNVAYKVTSEISGNLPFNQKGKHETMKAGSEAELDLHYAPVTEPQEGDLVIMYEDVNGVSRVDTFHVRLTDENWVLVEKRRNKSARVVMA
ncbi:hypothetical protein [Pseudomonas putida]|uniref:Uncharacterized protein n=1 Tax=Pseudomonas putida TaxID=303 RepID=A0A2C5W4Z0_PSEPU|nr:hypothetical protein [Pseudomonas putida]PHH38684.1 hypothetical protein CRX57_00345 [Pseudomonas putida]